jgi:hypothetical protein
MAQNDKTGSFAFRPRDLVWDLFLAPLIIRCTCVDLRRAGAPGEQRRALVRAGCWASNARWAGCLEVKTL